MDTLEKTYTSQQVAKRYHRAERTVNRWVRQGRITAINTGGGRAGPYVFRAEDLDAFDEQNLVGAKGRAEHGT